MEELDIKIQDLKNEIQDLENRIDTFTDYNRIPETKERFEQLKLLLKWRDLNMQLKSLKELKNSIRVNSKC